MCIWCYSCVHGICWCDPVYTHVHMNACVCHWLTSGVFFHPFPPYFLTQISHWTWSSSIQIEWVAIKLWEFACLYIPREGDKQLHSPYYMSVGDLNSSQHACVESILVIWQFFQTHNHVFSLTYFCHDGYRVEFYDRK